mgnify:CR=1 FL=1|tara:strand:- start:555 stop:710 length:156 start_codon:yes stop_codon:yes gene_type:complete
MEEDLEWLLELQEQVLWNLSFNISIEDSIKDMNLNIEEQKILLEYLNYILR